MASQFIYLPSTSSTTHTTVDQGNPNTLLNAWPVKAIQQGAWVVDVTQSGSWTVTADQGTSPWVVSATTLPLPTGAATEAKQDDEITLLTSINTALANPLAVTGPLTDAQLRATPVPVSGTVAATQSGAWSTGRTWVLDSLTDSVAISNFPSSLSVTQGTSPWVVDASGYTVPISASSLPLPTGAATETTLADIDTKLAGTLTISGTVAATQSGAWSTGRTWTLASGTDSVAAVQSGTWNIATLTTLTSITNPVAVTQSGTWNINNVSGTISLPTGAATETTLSTLNGKIPSNLTVTSTRLLIDGSGVTQPVSPVPSATNTNALSSAASTALVASLVVKASAGRLYQLSGLNTKNQAQYIQIHNTTSLPGNGATPVYVFIVPAGQNFSIDWEIWGRYFGTGITVCNSSTSSTLTVGTTDCWFNAEYL